MTWQIPAQVSLHLVKGHAEVRPRLTVLRSLVIQKEQITQAEGPLKKDGSVYPAQQTRAVWSELVSLAVSPRDSDTQLRSDLVV